MGFAYRLKSTGHSSERYGNCETCGQHCSEVFMQTETRGYRYPDTALMSYTYHNTNGALFGHRECLIRRQRIA